MNELKLSPKFIALIASACSALGGLVAGGAVGFYFDSRLANLEADLSQAEYRVGIRESHLRSIEMLATEFDIKFGRFALALMDENRISIGLRDELLENLQKQTSSLLALQGATSEYKESGEYIRAYQTHIDVARDVIESISDAGEMGELFRAYEQITAEQYELVSAIRQLPLIANGS